MAGLSDVIRSVSKAAPMLASVLATPLAGVGVSLLSSAFGVGKDANEIIKAISNDPESAIKLKTLEYEHAETLARIASTDYSTEVEDRKNARENAHLYKDFLRHMAYLVTLGFFSILFVLVLPLVPVENNERELLSMLVGMLVSKWQTIIDFFYGSNSRSIK